MSIGKSHQEAMGKSTYLFYAVRDAGVRTAVSTSSRVYLFSGWGRNEWQRSPLYIVLTLVHGVSVPIAVAAFFGFVVKPSPIDQHAFYFVMRVCRWSLFLIASQFQNVAGYYLFWTIPAYFILAGVACERIWRAVESQSGGNILGMLLPGVLVLTLFSQTYLYFQMENGGRPRWREAFEAIEVGEKTYG